ncbi:MAG: hypothetical protein ABIQ74_04060 [Chitinophagales bacterium]
MQIYTEVVFLEACSFIWLRAGITLNLSRIPQYSHLFTTKHSTSLQSSSLPLLRLGGKLRQEGHWLG